LEFYVNYLRSFNPPGKMSAGMSCEVVVTFKPMVSAPECKVTQCWESWCNPLVGLKA